MEIKRKMKTDMIKKVTVTYPGPEPESITRSGKAFNRHVNHVVPRIVVVECPVDEVPKVSSSGIPC